MKNKIGFTLIELLIVVAIIAILAAIAVPNFLEAQTRSKVSRVRSDMRSLKTGIESYAVDYNHYPDPSTYAGNGAGAMTRLEELTTPIAYMTSIPKDPFNLHGVPNIIGPEEFVYYTRPFFLANSAYSSAEVADNMFNTVLSGYGDQTPRARKYFMFSLGPDQKCDYVLGPYSPFGSICYDATNGTISKGDVTTWGP